MTLMTEIALKAPVFRSVPEDHAKDLLSKGHMKEAGRGASIHLQGERAHSMFIVLDGWVKLYRMSPCGTEAVVGVLTKGDCFGEAAAIRGEVYSTGAEAVTQAHMLQLDCHDLWYAVENDVVLCRSMLNSFVKGNTALVHQLEQLKSHSGAQRIADFLLGLCKDEVGESTVVLPYDKVLIAAWLGMKPESLSRSFRRLEGCGVKIVKDRAIIRSVERLMEFADEDASASWSAKACRMN
ncbi:Crp/Fnr family transcriptional regulator [Ovoidimarina sediminis]|uniref:Crp/Fnr family transcriptional regulator n=1 Tax=Ovoidimarina sediminis TaxID=3079856 RepID=UPI00290F5E84|nr:Crp/Fnr family transcriptional regulator [Rhodophyticola sp. MJ-SS7]MDU8941854.1 Crp/Fnr family transcriptional regulator [Rhodophyticola sp. MJ-SS7]